MNYLLGSNRLPISLAPAFVSGGEGSIHLVHARPGVVAKIYRRPEALHQDKLLIMVGSKIVTTGNALAWPQDLVFDAKSPARACGYTMPQVTRKETLLATLASLATSTSPGGRLEHRLALNISAIFSLLHSQGFVVGDVNHNNVLCGKDGTASLVDLDSIQVTTPSKTFRCPVGMAEYTPAELQGVNFASITRAVHHDLFGLAVLIFRLLMRGEHPFQSARTDKGCVEPLPARIKKGIWAHSAYGSGPYRPRKRCPPFGKLRPELQALFHRAFDDGHRDPHLRPSADEWRFVLDTIDRNQPLQTPLSAAAPSWFAASGFGASQIAEFLKQAAKRATTPQACYAAVFVSLGITGWVWREEARTLADQLRMPISTRSVSERTSRTEAPHPHSRGGDDRPRLWRRLLNE